MGHVFYDNESTIVRRKGGTDEVGCSLGYGKRSQDTVEYGDRRSRQIAKRHWLTKRVDYATSTSGGATYTSIKPPGKEEVVRMQSWY
jgi:hypothetical protein